MNDEATAAGRARIEQLTDELLLTEDAEQQADIQAKIARLKLMLKGEVET